MKMNNKGFSLVELMVVVAIIGILSAIAIPNFQRFQRKSRQSEVKTLLGGIYSAEKAFHTEWNTYHADLDVVGYIASGQLRYNAGFLAAGADLPAAIPGYSGPTETGNFNTRLICAAFATQCSHIGPAADTAMGAVAPAGVGTVATFTAGSQSADPTVCANVATPDRWTMNQLGVVTNTQSGI